ncbi:MAG: hypothetical protein R2856_05855 [Caldilineaceae bacterium]
MLINQDDAAVAEVEAMLARTQPVSSCVPVVGAALEIAHLASHVDWLISDQRDLRSRTPSTLPFWMATGVAQ